MKRWAWIGLALLIVSGASQLRAQELPSAAPQCLQPSELEDGDGDVGRNVTALSGADLCIKQHIFDEGKGHRLQYDDAAISDAINRVRSFLGRTLGD
jgi:hypothetical protein